MDEQSEHQRVAIFASGKGTNAQAIIEHFKKNERIKVALIVTNNPKAGVLEIARENKIPVCLLEREKFLQSDYYVHVLHDQKISFLVLAGFLWKLPGSLIRAYKGCIINIHPALLPGYGGKGMYGMHVHEAVINAKEKKSGITIHDVDELYDHGAIIFQASSPIVEGETAESLAAKIHVLEHTYYPSVIEQWIGLKNIVKR